MKRLLVPLFALGVLLSACQTTVTDDGTGPVKIGYIGPLTGDASPYGVDSLNGMKHAVDEINADGGIHGRQIEIVAEDGRCNATDASAAAQKLVHVDKVVAIVGGQCSGETLAAAPIAEAAKLVMIAPISSSPDVTDAGDFVFRNYPSDGLKTKALAKYLVEEGKTNVAVITENTDFATAFRDSFAAAMPDGAVVFSETVDANTKDYRSLITRLSDIEFDSFLANGQTSATIGAMIQQLREQGYDQPIFSNDVALDKSLLEIAPDASDGMQATGVPDVAETTDFGQAISQKYGAAQASYAFIAHAYDATNVLVNALSKVGFAGADVRDHLYGLRSHKGVVGSFSFDDNGDVLGIPFVLYEARDGAWVAVQDMPL